MIDPKKHSIVVIMPVFNEGSVLHEVLQKLISTNYTTIVVDDGSETSLKSSLKNYPIYFLRHQANLGQGAALQTGFDFARKLNPTAIVCMDADGQHDISDIETLLEPLKKNEADIVMGSRFLTDNTTHIPFARKILIKIARLINYVFSGLLLTDAHNGFRAFNTAALQKMQLTENRMAHASEFLFEVKKHGLRFKEVPVHIAYTDYSRGKGQSTWQSIRILFDIILHKLFK